MKYQDLIVLRSQFVTSSLSHGGRRYLPYAFTEQGVAMLSSVLKSKRAIQVNIDIMRAFVQMRQVILSQHVDSEKITELEQIQKVHGHLLNEHNDNISVLFEALREMETAEAPEKPKIGFVG